MTVVLDTNILNAALISQGVCAHLLEHCALRHRIVCSEEVLAELHLHLSGKFKYSAHEADLVLDLLRPQMEIVVPQALDGPVCRDADDDMVLGTGIAGNAERIVTSDKDLLVIQHY